MSGFEGIMVACRTLQLAALAAVALPAAAAAQSDRLVSIRNLTPHEHRSAGFVLASAQTVRIQAVGAEPAPRSRRREQDWWGPDDERDVWPAAAWILDARTRAVVWDLRTARTNRSPYGLHRFDDTLRLAAGTYEAHYASYPAAWQPRFSDGSLRTILRGLVGVEQGERYGGPYVDDGAFREFELVVTGAGQPARERDLEAARGVFTQTAIVRLAPAGPDSLEHAGFTLDRSAEVDILASGEARDDEAFDFGWIMHADTRERVWTLSYANSREGGGARKNRVAHTTVRLPAGRYVAFFVTDDTHYPRAWNAVPPLDPALWGLTLRIADPAARAAVRRFVYEPVPAGQTIASLTGIGDNETRSAGFAIKRPLEVRIYALGEGTGGETMHDYAWIVDAATRRRVWTMSYRDTEHAGGAEKNRLFDGTLRLEPGNYLVYYRSDGSHSAHAWNAPRPPYAQYWGVSVFPASGTLDRSIVGPLEPGGGSGAVLAELLRMGDDARGHAPFTLERETVVRIYALGEGRSDEMFDYAWIEIAGSGRVVWDMTYRVTAHAGGASKNRMFDGSVRLPAGSYVLRYTSDGSHSYDSWNSDPPDDAPSWGVVVRRPPAPAPTSP